ncbi:MAG: hypothetical protein H8E27_10580 [Verrucomicrobia subdivision 3 bacterium]|nr:hypothetical protein [Limisphaerales bacterium]
MKTPRHIPLLLGLLALFTLMRWPGLLPWNFSPVYAICFCAGVYFKGPRAWLVPVAFMFVSDVLMNFFHWRGLGFSTFTSHMWVTYSLYLALAAVGWWMTDQARPTALIAGGVLGACGFFLVINSFAWLSNPVYAKTWAGLVQSFTIGQAGYPPPIVFLKNTITSGAMFTAAIVFAVHVARAKERESAEFQLKA